MEGLLALPFLRALLNLLQPLDNEQRYRQGNRQQSAHAEALSGLGVEHTYRQWFSCARLARD